jgi:hypothetical protein
MGFFLIYSFGFIHEVSTGYCKKTKSKRSCFLTKICNFYTAQCPRARALPYTLCAHFFLISPVTKKCFSGLFMQEKDLNIDPFPTHRGLQRAMLHS